VLEEILCDDKGDLDPDCGVVWCGVVWCWRLLGPSVSIGFTWRERERERNEAGE